MFYISFWLVSNIRKIVYLLKNIWLRYATCVSYIAKLIVKFLTNINKKRHCAINHNHTYTRREIPWAFFQEHTYPFIGKASRGSYNSQEFDRNNLFLLLMSLFPQETFYSTLETPTSNTCQTLEISNKLVQTSAQPAPLRHLREHKFQVLSGNCKSILLSQFRSRINFPLFSALVKLHQPL